MSVMLQRMWSVGVPQDLSGRVVVITGASSGIGRACAYACAQRHAAVVLAARDSQGLREAAAECEAAGGYAQVEPTDVADHESVRRLARSAYERNGHIDVWINNASVMAYGMFEDVPADVYHHVIDTNFYGQVHGARAVLPYFRAQGAGVLINVASLYSKLTSPYVSPYVSSKYAIRGFSACLRQELMSAEGIHVCAIFPGAIDTPIFRHVANYTGRGVTALPPVADPQRVVRAVLSCITHPRAEVVVGETARAIVWAHAVAPRVYDRLARYVMDLVAFDNEIAEDTTGNVFASMPEWNQVDGRWREERATTRKLFTAGGVAAAAAVPAATWILRRRLGAPGK